MNRLNSTLTLTLTEKTKAYYELMKPRLSFLVVFSSAFGYILGMASSFDWFTFIGLSLGGFLVSGASVTINQIKEIQYDAVMKRTMSRPLPTGRISEREAMIASLVWFVVGLVLFYIFTNPLTVGLSFISMVLYAYVYTPLKRIGPIAVTVGAIPGALPPLIGWVAATGNISFEAIIIFGIQFIWQFPHFWAIAWVADEDYKKAGFKLLPGGGGKDLNTAINIMTYTLFLLPLGLFPAYLGITGITSAVIATICGVGFLTQTLLLMKDNSRKSALRIMFGSFLYLPIVQIAYLLDKV